MSAREGLFSLLVPAFGWPEYADELLDAYRAEVLREAADTLDRSRELIEYTDDHMSDINQATRLLRCMAEGHVPEVSEEEL